MRLSFIFLLFLNIVCLDEKFDDRQEYINKKFNDKLDSLNNIYVENIDFINKEYEKLQTEHNRLFENQKKEILKKWNNFEHSTNKKYVEYINDNNSRLVVDFEKGNLVIEVLSDEEFNKADALEMISSTLEKALSIKVDEDFYLLENQLKTDEDIVIDPSNIETNIDELLSKQKIKISDSYTANDGEERVSYSVTIPFADNHLNARASKYKDIIIKNSKRFNLDPAIVFAIIETESAFNPKAKSHIPAYGLMQLVPKSGARDAYKFLYNKDKFLSSRYLYNPEKNIELGCAYLHQIRNVYFKDIVNDEKAFMCSIAAYNTGIGNVSMTLSKTKNLKAASSAANRLSEKKLYRKLCNKLEYEEARNYISKVWDRKDKYSS